MDHQPLSLRMTMSARGYHAFPLSVEDLDVDPEHQQAWREYDAILQDAKKGVFQRVSSLFQLHEESKSWVFRLACSRMLGDATPESDLKGFVETKFDACSKACQLSLAPMLTNWGDLSVVPVLFKLLSSAEAQDGLYIPLQLSLLLEKKPGPVREYSPDLSSQEKEAYQRLVIELHEDVRTKVVDEGVPIFQGGVLNVRSVAYDLVHGVNYSRGRDKELRHKFETTTGIDCSTFFIDDVFHPLNASVVAEQFLESGEADKYEPGVRYFFGHRIPD